MRKLICVSLLIFCAGALNAQQDAAHENGHFRRCSLVPIMPGKAVIPLTYPW